MPDTSEDLQKALEAATAIKDSKNFEALPVKDVPEASVGQVTPQTLRGEVLLPGQVHNPVDHLPAPEPVSESKESIDHDCN